MLENKNKRQFNIILHRYNGTEYIQKFIYEADNLNISVASLLIEINSTEDYTDNDGNIIRGIAWECSCLQKKCGACAMVINHRPCLACDTFLSDIAGDTIEIEPLRKFPIVKDLIVDRKVMFDKLSSMSV